MCVKLLGDTDETKELLKCLNISESYLKGSFRTHCNYNDSCSIHCNSFALSHPSDKELLSRCDKFLDSMCEECLTLVDSVATLKLKVGRLPLLHEREVAEYDVANAETKTYNAWRTTIKSSFKCVQKSRCNKFPLDS